MSRLARQGSNTSVSSTSSIDSSSHHHILSQIRQTPKLSTWLEQAWSPQNSPHERIATGTMRMGMAVFTREMMEMHIQQAPDVRGMLDCLPVADRSNLAFIGWRQKLGTWPLTKHQAWTAKEFAC